MAVAHWGGRGTQQREVHRDQRHHQLWRSPLGTTEDRSPCQDISNVGKRVAVVLRDDRGSQRGVRVEVRGVVRAWRSSSGVAKDRDMASVAKQSKTKPWRSLLGAAEDRNWKGWGFDEMVSSLRSLFWATEDRNAAWVMRMAGIYNWRFALCGGRESQRHQRLHSRLHRGTGGRPPREPRIATPAPRARRSSSGPTEVRNYKDAMPVPTAGTGATEDRNAVQEPSASTSPTGGRPSGDRGSQPRHHGHLSARPPLDSRPSGRPRVAPAR